MKSWRWSAAQVAAHQACELWGDSPDVDQPQPYSVAQVVERLTNPPGTDAVSTAYFEYLCAMREQQRADDLPDWVEIPVSPRIRRRAEVDEKGSPVEPFA